MAPVFFFGLVFAALIVPDTLNIAFASLGSLAIMSSSLLFHSSSLRAQNLHTSRMGNQEGHLVCYS